jgi:predicted enzyme related to lactoylglutathione lyase
MIEMIRACWNIPVLGGIKLRKLLILLVAIVLSFELTYGLRGVDMTENDKRIDYIELPTVDIIEAKNFYGDVFGWTFVDYGPEYTSFNDGRLDGGFRKESEVQRGGPLIIIYSVNLEEIRDKVKAAGGTIVKEIFEFPGGRRFHFTDPSGNELAIWSDK